MTISPEEHTAAIPSLQSAVAASTIGAGAIGAIQETVGQRLVAG